MRLYSFYLRIGVSCVAHSSRSTRSLNTMPSPNPADWSAADVQEWLHAFNLPEGVIQGFQLVTGAGELPYPPYYSTVPVAAAGPAQRRVGALLAFEAGLPFAGLRHAPDASPST